MGRGNNRQAEAAEEGILQRRRWVAASLTVAAALAVGFVVAAVAIHLEHAQFIGADELKQSVGALESYTAEAQVVSDQAQQPGASLRSYTEAYSSALQEAVDSVSEKLAVHAHADNLTPQIQTTLRLADSLSGRLQTQVQSPTSQLPGRRDSDQLFDHIQSQLQAVEDTL